MVENFRLHDASVIIADGDVRGRHEAKSSLYYLGFREFREGRTFKELEVMIYDQMPDLIIADYALPGGDVCDLCHRIRHHRFAGDPFVPIIVTVATPSAAMVGRVIDTGADHLMVKPWTKTDMEERVQNMIYSRKPFAVTSEYVGPDRRSNPRDTSAPLLQVPNSLHARVVDKMSRSDFQAAVDATARQVNEHKIDRHAEQILWLANKILPVYAGAGPDQKLKENLDRLAYVAEDMARRCDGGPSQRNLPYLHKLERAVKNIQVRYNTPDPIDLAAVEDMSRKIGALFL